MVTLFHGDNTLASRKALNQYIESEKRGGINEILRFDAKELDITQIVQVLTSESLFGNDRLIIIERLFSLKKKPIKEQFTTEVGKTQLPVALWEDKLITKTELNKIPKLKVFDFKTPAVIFKFLDAIDSPNKKLVLELLDQAVEQDSPELIFQLLSRHCRLLIRGYEGTVKGAPWQAQKLVRQSKNLGIDKVLSIHSALYEIDHRIKSGMSVMGMKGELELLVTKL